MGAVDIIKYNLVPGSVTFLATAVALGAVLLYVRPRAARLWFTVLAILYVVLSLGIVSSALEIPLSRAYREPVDADTVRGATAIVVLGGGSATFRARGEQLDLPTPQSALAALEGARLHRLMPTALVIASGGRPLPDRQLAPESAALREVLIRLGVTPDRIVEESQSRTTHEQAINMGLMLKRHQVRRFVLVATPLHMWRAVRMFRREGLDPIPAPAVAESEPLRAARNEWLPSMSALRASEAALYHYFAIVYARVQGWL